GHLRRYCEYGSRLCIRLLRDGRALLVTDHRIQGSDENRVAIERIGEAAPRKRTLGERPMSGIRVLDLTRVIAGPVCGRTLAAHGADVLAISGPTLPFMGTLIMDVGRGKRTAHIELTDPAGRETLAGLARDADVFVQGFRPGAIAGKGFSPERVAALSPGIIAVSLCAYGYSGPWSGRRGFDSLVQTASGINHAEASAAGVTGPKELPCQALDHATGYFMAFGAMMALIRQMREGGSWHVRVSLAATGHWLSGLGRQLAAIKGTDVPREAIGDLLEESASGFGPMSAVRHAGLLSRTPPHWTRPSMPLGSHEARW
ncbi:MAG TPA: CoA transferase, partial [Hyphomicrobiaceae bacterium]|nr:CoA transferase [Hyphomicrobiaceae bacterium]